MDETTRRADLGDNRDGLGRDRTAAVTAEETMKLIAADRVQGTPVFNRESKRLGTIERVMLNKHSGKVAFAVLRYGGFLGLGERYHPLPWDRLTYDESLGGYNVDAEGDPADGTPPMSRAEMEDWTGGPLAYPSEPR